jgi:hypothetical protein
MDFVLDDVSGPLLSVQWNGSEEIKVSRTPQSVRASAHQGCGSSRESPLVPSVMDDANGNREANFTSQIQETGQEQRPARMVGLSSSDFAETGTEAGRRHDAGFSRATIEAELCSATLSKESRKK